MDLVVFTILIINSRNWNQAPTIGDFGSLEELFDLGDRLKSNTMHNGMVVLRFIEESKYYKIIKDMAIVEKSRIKFKIAIKTPRKKVLQTIVL